jgi:hypothetical protein
MSLVRTIAYTLFALGSAAVNRKQVITWKMIDAWIRVNAKPSNNGRGFAGSQLPDPRWRPYVQLRRSTTNSAVTVQASFFLDSNSSRGLSQTWEGRALDHELSQFFGKSYRKRIDV